MSIRWDSLLVHHTARELNEALVGARLRALRLDGVAGDLTLFFRQRTLVWRLHPTRGYPLLRPPVEPGEEDLPFSFRVRRVAALPDERIIKFELMPVRGRRGPRDVIVELLGNQWNAIVTEAETGIVRHVLWTRKGRRAPVTGHEYQPPPPGRRMGISGDVSVQSWQDVLDGVPAHEHARRLVARIAWVSPLNAGAILGESVPQLESPAAYHRWAQLVPPRAPEPVVLDGTSGPQPYPFPLPGRPYRGVESLLAGFEECASTSDGEELVAPLLPPDLVRRLDRAVVQASRRVDRLRVELANLEDSDELRQMGDLILSRYRDIVPGAREVALVDFAGNQVRIVLDPTAAPHENAARYYQRAAKSRRATERLPELLREARSTFTELTELARRAETGGVSASEVRESLPPVAARQQGGQVGASLPYRVFRSSGGLEIRVGRGARHNDDLTFHHCAPNDVWLHARHNAGAHVVLRWPGPGNPPARDLHEAGSLAALHSKARTSSRVPVDWTFRKYVRKPRGSAPGSVLPERVKTIFVDPDPTLKDTLDQG